VWGMKTSEEARILKLFKNNSVFQMHAETILLQQKHKRELAYAANLDKRILDEVDRFIKERDKK